MFVYMIINDANGKYYVGKTVSSNLQKYFRQQLWAAQAGRKHKPHLYNAIRKYGAGAFRVHPLMSTLTSDEQLCEQERFLIGLFNARDPKTGYNIAAGGQQGGFPNPLKGKKLPDEWRARVTEAHRTEQFKARASASHRGFRASDATKQKLSRRMLANPIKHWEGKTLSSEHRAAISRSGTGKVRPNSGSRTKELGIKPSRAAAVLGGKVAGRLNSHKRWHVDRGLTSSECALCVKGEVHDQI